MLAVVTLPANCGAQDTFISVGSGASSGLYYTLSKALCGLVNRDQAASGVWCSPEATPGSVYNLQRLRSGELDLAIIQSDVQFQAFMGRNAWAGNATASLRSVLSLYPELVTVIARADSGIRDLSGLKARRFNVGALGSGTRATWDALEGSLGWDADTNARKSTLKPETAMDRLCSGELDANLLLVGHPSSFVKKQLSACRATLVPLDGVQIDSFVSRHPYYRRGTIPASAYGTETDVPTFGVTATLVTTAGVADKVIYAVVKAAITNFDEFKSLAPALQSMHGSQVMRQVQTAPLHPGAARAFQDLGMDGRAAIQ
jgi:TRAP transporter TAXI family solute receptor